MLVLPEIVDKGQEEDVSEAFERLWSVQNRSSSELAWTDWIAGGVRTHWGLSNEAKTSFYRQLQLSTPTMTEDLILLEVHKESQNIATS
jgi:hypothetical protein